MRLLSITIIVFSILTAGTGNVVAQPVQMPEFVYRADTRAPSDVRRAGGFVARGVDASRPGTIVDLSLFNHAIGHAGPQNDYSGYVATTTDFMWAYHWLWESGGGFRSGYVYTIRPTANFIDVNASLGRYLEPVTREEHEWAAMGRIHWYQVVGWRSAAEPPTTPITPNPQYNPNHIAFTLPPAASQPALAHFPVGHPAWNEMPWRAFTNCAGSSSPNRKSTQRLAAGECIPFENGAMDYKYYSGYLADLSSKACGGPCLEGERSSNQDEMFCESLIIRLNDSGPASCDHSEEEVPESIAEIYKLPLCHRMNVGDKLRVRGGYLSKLDDSSCTMVGALDNQRADGAICQPRTNYIFETNSSIPGCPAGYELVTAEDLETNASICFTQLDLHSVARLAGRHIVSGSEHVPCLITKGNRQTETSLCKKISRTTPEIVVSSESPEGSVCWGRYSPVNVKQAMANRTKLCSMLFHSSIGVTQIGLADGWFGAASCAVWKAQLPQKPAYTFCNNGVGEGNRFLSTMTLVKTGETCPAGFELATESDFQRDPKVCYGELPPGSSARLAHSASVTRRGYNETTKLCSTKSWDSSILTMAVCKAVAPAH